MIIMEGQGCGRACGRRLCLVFLFFTMSSNGVAEWDSDCQSGEKNKTSADKRQEKPWSALTTLLFHLPLFCVVEYCVAV